MNAQADRRALADALVLELLNAGPTKYLELQRAGKAQGISGQAIGGATDRLERAGVIVGPSRDTDWRFALSAAPAQPEPAEPERSEAQTQPVRRRAQPDLSRLNTSDPSKGRASYLQYSHRSGDKWNWWEAK